MPLIFNISYLYDSIIYTTITLCNNMMYNNLDTLAIFFVVI